MKTFSRAALPLLLASATLFGQSMSRDEAAVRGAYAAVELRTRIDSILASYHQSPLATDQKIKIELSDWHAGPISEVLATPISTLVTVPRGELVITSPESHSLNDHFLAMGVKVHWGPVNQRYGFNGYSMFDAPLREIWEGVLAATPEKFRYSAYSVSVSSQGKSRSYRAIAILREDGPPGFVDYILSPGDNLLGKDLVKDLVNLHNILPVRSTDLPVFGAFFEEITMFHRNCTLDASTQLCCDPTDDRCGVPHSAFLFVR